jgi:chromosome segregation ATPase
MTSIALYIKRAEMCHTKEYISDVFLIQQYGKVHNVRFIKKTNDIGKEYNGAIVTFEQWNTNSNVKILFDQLNSSQEGTAKIIHDYTNKRYWIVTQYKSEFAEFDQLTKIDPGLNENDRILELENIIKSMAAQMHFMKTQHEKQEKEMMDCQQRETQAWLYNGELKSQILEKDEDIKWLTKTVSNLSYELAEMTAEKEELALELNDQENILAYVEAQANEMRDMLQINFRQENTDTKGKMSIEELID